MAARLAFGIAAVCTPQGAHPVDVAAACEEHGFELLLFPEHSHLPGGHATRRPAGPPAGRDYVDLYDSLAATALALAATRRLRVGTGVAVLTQRDPIGFAKAVASLDVLSGGRIVAGVGAGWNHAELRDHGVEPGERYALLDRKLALVRALLGGDGSALAQEGVDPGEVFGPRPLQQPVPVFVGGESAAARALAERHDARWLPSWRNPERLLGRIAEARVPTGVFGAPADTGLLERLAGFGVDLVVFRASGRETVAQIASLAAHLGLRSACRIDREERQCIR